MTQPLNKLTIKGFKSIQNLEDFHLANLNVLIGGNGAGKSKKRRKPSHVIAEKGKILGDIVSPVFPPNDWEVLQ